MSKTPERISQSSRVRFYGKRLSYLDSAASAQTPRAVIDAMRKMQEHEYANVHRGLHYLANTATAQFENARRTVQTFLNAASSDEIVFTSGATDAINLVAASFVAPDIRAGDEIILSVLEHHSNIVPWHFLRERYGAVLKWIPCRDDGSIILEEYEKLISSKTKIVAITQTSNVLGTMTPLDQIIEIAHQHGVAVLVDGCQGVVHGQVDVQKLQCDFYVFSGHKLYGPNGIGVLYARRNLLETMRPYRGGGEMIREVSRDEITYGDPPHKFEAGTPPIVEAVGLAAAIDYLNAFDWREIHQHEQNLRAQAEHELSKMNSVSLLGANGVAAPRADRAPIISFVADGAHPHDLAALMDQQGVAIRAGHHCAQPLMARLGLTATARASFAFYNNDEDVAQLAASLRKAIGFFS